MKIELEQAVVCELIACADSYCAHCRNGMIKMGHSCVEINEMCSKCSQGRAIELARKSVKTWERLKEE